MNEPPFASLKECFGEMMPGPRVEGRFDHRFVEILLITGCAALCGAESWSEVEEENTFHWTLDVVFGEDSSRVRLDDAPENLAVICHITMNLLKRHPAKLSLKRKLFRATLDDSFLRELRTSF